MLVELSIALALRLSEVLSIEPTDIDLENSVAHIPGTKTELADNDIPILAPVRALVEDALPHLPIHVGDAGEYRNIRRDLVRACKRAGIDPCTPNDLRRTTATILVEAGVSLDMVRRIMRHTTTRMVELVYGQPTPAAIAANIEPHIAAIQIPVPDDTIYATVKSRKGIKHRKSRKSLSQLSDLNRGPVVYENREDVGRGFPYDSETAQVLGRHYGFEVVLRIPKDSIALAAATAPLSLKALRTSVKMRAVTVSDALTALVTQGRAHRSDKGYSLAAQ